MAYKKLNTVDYFPHQVTHGRKMFIVRNLYGNDGYAVWFMLLEELGKAHNHFINLSDNTQLLYLTAEMKVSQETFLSIINTLVELEEFDKRLWQEVKIIYSEKFVDSIKEAYNRRKNGLKQYSEICMQFFKNGTHNSENGMQFSKIVDSFPQTIRDDTRRDDTRDINKININVDFVKLKDFFNQVTGKKSRAVSQKVKTQISARLKEGFTKEDIVTAIKNCYADEYHIANNHKHLTLEFISRADKLEKYASVKKSTESKQQQSNHLKRDTF